MISAELLGALEHVIAASMRMHGTYKRRKDGQKRVFGGANVVMCADFWQLHPTGGTFLASNPVFVDMGRAQNALNIFWGGVSEDGQLDCIRSLWQLTEVMRCKDPWYNEFMRQCRHGALSLDMYCFSMAYPLLHPHAQTVCATLTQWAMPFWAAIGKRGETRLWRDVRIWEL